MTQEATYQGEYSTYGNGKRGKMTVYKKRCVLINVDNACEMV